MWLKQLLAWCLLSVTEIQQFQCATRDKDILFHLEKKVLNSGFHRELTIRFYTDEGADVESCVVLVKQKIPANAYVDPYQIKEIKRSGGPDILVPMDVDVEKPAESSTAMDAFIYVTEAGKHVGRQIEYFTSFPIHVRYHAPGDGFASFTVPTTDVLLRCNMHTVWGGYMVEAPCNSANTSRCQWVKASVEELDPVTITVPVGMKYHEQMVTVITLLVTSAGCLYLLFVIFRHKDNNSKEQ